MNAATRPTSITVFGVLNLFFVFFGLYGLFANVILLVPSLAQPDNPIFGIMESSAGLRAWIVFRVVFTTLQVSALGISGVGLLMSRAWGRSIALLCAGASIAFLVIAFVADWFLVMVPLNEAAGAGDPVMMGAIGGLLGNLTGMIYPACTLFFLNREHVKSFFAPTPPVETFG